MREEFLTPSHNGFTAVVLEFTGTQEALVGRIGFEYSLKMPKIFEAEGYSFFFYSNEHRPIHVHVRYGAGEAIINIEPEVKIRESYGLKVRELRKAVGLAKRHQKLIVEKWHENLD